MRKHRAENIAIQSMKKSMKKALNFMSNTTKQ